MGTETDSPFLNHALKVLSPPPFSQSLFFYPSSPSRKCLGSSPPPKFLLGCTMAGLRMISVETTLSTSFVFSLIKKKKNSVALHPLPFLTFFFLGVLVVVLDLSLMMVMGCVTSFPGKIRSFSTFPARTLALTPTLLG